MLQNVFKRRFKSLLNEEEEEEEDDEEDEDEDENDDDEDENEDEDEDEDSFSSSSSSSSSSSCLYLVFLRSVFSAKFSIWPNPYLKLITAPQLIKFPAGFREDLGRF